MNRASVLRAFPVSNPTRRGAFMIAAALATSFAGAQVTANSNRVEIADSVVPALAQSRKLASVPAAEIISGTLALQPRDLAGLQAVADAVSDPASPRYRAFLTPEQIGQRYGASAADRQAVVDFLASKGMSVSHVAANGMAITVSGTAEQWENAFATKLAVFKGPDADGSTITFRANTTALTVPEGLSKVVTYVSGIETHTHPKPKNTTTFSPGQTSAVYGLKTSQGFNYYGQGRHVAISNFDGYRIANAQTYASPSGFSLPLPPGGFGTNISKVIIPGQANGETYSASGEGDLDIQMVLGQAPLADIRIYDGASNTTADLIGTLSRESSDNWADVITESYGWSGGATFWNNAHNQHVAMTAQGITYMGASGDSGTNFGNFPYPDFDPEVLMVGGTIATVDTNTFASTGNRVSEIGWSGGGGGWYNSPTAVTFNTLPSWQKGPGVPTNVNRRLVPDIAFHAAGANSNDPGAHLVVYTYQGQQGFYGFSGTSCSSPLFAGMLATIQGRLYTSYTGSGRPRMGRIANLIYSQKGRADVYHDITSGANGNLPTNSTGTSNTHNGPASVCTPFWDYVTGWGSMDMNAFYKTFFGGRG